MADSFTSSLISPKDWPKSWRKARCILIPQEYEWHLTSHLRPMQLLSAVAKCFSRVLLCKLQHWWSPDFLSIGFRTHHQANELTRLVVHAMENGIEWQRDTHVVKTDLTKAYDRTKWSTIWSELQDRGAPGRLVRATIKLLDWREVEFIILGLRRLSL